MLLWVPSVQGKLPGEPCRFVNRQDELGILEKAYQRRPGLLVVYGRRRIGKSRLIAEWLSRKKKSVYYVAHLTSHTDNLRGLASRASRQLGDPIIESVTYDNLGSLLTMIHRSGGEIVVIDEYTYWARASPRVLSELQEFVDHTLPSTNMLVVISGSLLGVMERNVLGGGAPLYARATSVLRLKELSYPHLKEFLPLLSPEDRVRVYALVGGIPYYLCQLHGTTTIREAVERLITSPGSMLREEKDLILREELRDPHAYNAILSALAEGYVRPAAIADVTGLDPSHVRKYLHTLEYIHIVERVTPLFKRKGWYKISDPVIRTWFTLVKPVIELLDLGKRSEALDEILQKIDVYTSKIWEQIVSNHLLKLHAGKGYLQYGPLLHKGEEIDIALLDPGEKKAVVAEAKWSNITRGEAEKLRRKTEARAQRLLPSDYTVEKVYIAVRSLVDEVELPDWILTPAVIESL